MSLKLNLDFHNSTKTPVDSAIFKTMAQEFLSYRGIEGDVALEILVVGEQRIQTMNHEHRNVNKPTDVLSFPLYESPSSQPVGRGISDSTDAHASWNDKTVIIAHHLGSIIICPNIVLHHWKLGMYGAISPEYAMIYVVIHGLMHLLGRNHDTDKEFARWEEVVEKFWPRVSRHLSTARH